MIRERLFEEENETGGSAETPPPSPPQDPTAALQAELSRISTSLAGLQQQNAAAAVPKPPAQPVNTPPTKDQLTEQFWKDPVGVQAQLTQAAVGEALSQMQMQNIPTLMAQARTLLRGSTPLEQAIFDEFAPQLDQAISGIHPLQRGNIENWKLAYNYIKGENMDRVLEIRNKFNKTRTVSQTPAGPAAPSPKAPPAPAVIPLSEDEASFIRKFGITEEQYRRGTSDYEKQSAIGPSSWDAVLTFDNRGKRRPRGAQGGTAA